MTANAIPRQMPSDSKETASLIYSVTGFLTGKTVAELDYQPHKLKLCPNSYALHIPSGKAGRITGTAMEEHDDGRRQFRKVYGIAWDSEFPSEVLRRITPKQYKALPEDCKIVSPETGIF